MNDRRGFTLLELLMVVIIIGILASIALPQYIRASEKARAAEALSLLGAIRASEVRFKSQAGDNSYTATLADLDVEIPSFGAWSVVSPFTVTAAAAPAASTGYATLTRNAGQYAAQVIGIQFTTGTICGNFAPVQPPAIADCVED